MAGQCDGAWFVIGFRTPFFHYHSGHHPELDLPPLLRPLFSVAAEFAESKQCRNVIIGNCFSPQPTKAVRFLENLSGGPTVLRAAVSRATIACIEGACLTSLSAPLVAGPPPRDQIDFYFGFEDLSVSRSALVNHGAGWPGFPRASDLCRQVSGRYGVTVQDARGYIGQQAQRARAAVPDHVVPIAIGAQSPMSDYAPLERLVAKCASADRIDREPFLARFARGGTVLISTTDPELAARHHGLRIMASCSLSFTGNSADLWFIDECASLALSRAGLTWSDVQFIELYDGYLAVALAALQNIERRARCSFASKVNLLGSAIVRGDPVAAVGGLLITNAETLLYCTGLSWYAVGLIIAYSAGTAVSLVVSGCT